jgi:hypothetical protein
VCVWARLGVACLGCVMHENVEQGVEEVQESGWHTIDMLVHAQVGQGREWHGELMPCHGMTCSGTSDDANLCQSLSNVFGKAPGGQ